MAKSRPEWQRTLAIVWVTQFFTIVAMSLGLTFIPIFLKEDPALGITDMDAIIWYSALIYGAPFLATIFATPLWGWLADRKGRKAQIVRAAIGLALSQILMGLAQSPDQLVAIRFFQGLISGVIAANLGLITGATPNEFQGRAISLLQSSTPAGMIVGPIIGGLLVPALGFRPVYFILGGIIALTAVMVAILVRERNFVPGPRRNPFRGIWEALRESVRRAPLRAPFVVLMISAFCWNLVNGVFTIFIMNRITAFGVDQGWASMWWSEAVIFVGLCMTVTGIGHFLMSTRLWGREIDRRSPYLVTLSASVLAAASLTLAFNPTLAVIIMARLALGFGQGGMIGVSYAEISRAVAPEQRGQFMGLATSSFQFGNMAGFFAGGLLAQEWGLEGNFLLSAALLALVAVLFGVLQSRRRRTVHEAALPYHGSSKKK